MSDAFVKVIESHGGRVLLRTPVDQIETQSGRVVGVFTKRYGCLKSEVVVSNAAAPLTFERLLDNPRLATADAEAARSASASVSLCQIYVGIQGCAEELGLRDRLLVQMPTYDLDQQWAAIERGAHLCTNVIVANHNLSDPSFVPQGRSILNATMLADGRHWEAMDTKTYEQEKRTVESYLVQHLQTHIPNLRDRIEVLQTGTPRTMQRYSWNPLGAVYGVAPSPRAHPLRRSRPRTAVPGLYLAGAWTFPLGGFEGAMTSGIHTAELIVDDTRR